MTDQASQKRLMVQYLFGDLPAERRAEFEDEYLKDSEIFQELVALENELIDQYILGELPPAEQERFERSFLANPARRETVETARSLLSYSANAESPPKLATQARPWFSGRLSKVAAPAVFLLILCGIVWLAVSNRKMANEVARLKQEQDIAMQERRALEQQVETLKTGLQRRGSANQQTAQVMQETVLFTLAPAISRGLGEATTLVIPPRTAYVLLRIVLQDDSHSRYSLSIRAVEGSLAWKQSNVEAVNFAHGKEVAVTVPSHLLKNGDYVLRVSAGPEDILHTLAGYSFHVTRGTE